MLVKLVLVIVLIHCVSLRESGAEFTIDDECTIPHSGAKGNCKLLKNCHKAIEALRNNLTRPTNCGFLGEQEIVCCAIEAEITRTLRIDPIPSSKRVQKCEEYAKSVYEEKQVILLTNTTMKNVRVDTCGLTAVPLIVGTLGASSREFPHFALLGINATENVDGDIEWVCGGSLVSTRYVLFAAHCLVTRKGPVQKVRLGDFHNDENLIDMLVEETILHPDFKVSAIYNDIGLVKLAEKIKFSQFIRPICLPTSDTLPSHNTVMALGWNFNSVGRTDKNKLFRQAIRTLTNDECNLFFQSILSRKLRNGITDKQICTESNTEQYYDDIGDMLQIYHPDTYCMYTQIGVASIVVGNGIPGVYTGVFKYSDWIVDVIWGSGADD